MAEYINKAKAIAYVEEQYRLFRGDIKKQAIVEGCIEALMFTPSADVVEVKHGEWIETKEWYFDEYAQSEYQRKCYECSICKRTELYKEPYCHCGAKMDRQ